MKIHAMKEREDVTELHPELSCPEPGFTDVKTARKHFLLTSKNGNTIFDECVIIHQR